MEIEQDLFLGQLFLYNESKHRFVSNVKPIQNKKIKYQEETMMSKKEGYSRKGFLGSINHYDD